MRTKTFFRRLFLILALPGILSAIATYSLAFIGADFSKINNRLFFHLLIAIGFLSAITTFSMVLVYITEKDEFYLSIDEIEAKKKKWDENIKAQNLIMVELKKILMQKY